MPRKPRFNLPGVPQHIVQRGNNRARCFFAEQDYRQYLDDLAVAAQKYRCEKQLVSDTLLGQTPF